ncbi:MAG: WD40 repeat domain-containing protein [Pedosphaera sp.]|nr:WD40 repeat domain-containing protein [Pedosphaera sp.]
MSRLHHDWGVASAIIALALSTARALEPIPVPITALAFSPDGLALVSNGSRRVDIRSVHDGSVRSHFPCDLPKISAIAFQPRGNILAVAGGEPAVRGEVRLFDWRTQTVAQRLTNPEDLATSVRFNTSGTLLGVGSANHSASVWRTAPGSTNFTKIFTLTGHAGPVLAIAFSPIGRTIVTGSADRSIKVWSTEDGRLLRTFSHHLECVNALVFRPQAASGDEAFPVACASASDDRTVRIWQPEIGRMVRIIRQHRAPAFALVYAPDGLSLFSAGKEGRIRRFDAESDTLFYEGSASSDWIYALAVSPDGSKLASGDWSGAVLIRDLRGDK